MESRTTECCGWDSWGELAGIGHDGRPLAQPARSPAAARGSGRLAIRKRMLKALERVAWAYLTRNAR